MMPDSDEPGAQKINSHNFKNTLSWK